MTNNGYQNAAQPDPPDRLLLAELRNQLNAELEKPDDELDAAEINRITETVDALTGSDRITAEKSQEGIQMIKGKLRQEKKSRIIRRAKWAAACACLMLVLSNIWSYSVFGTNVFHVAYRLGESGGIEIDLASEDARQDDSEEKTVYPYQTEEYSGGNPYEADMRQLCMQNGFDADTLIPRYLPEGFTITPAYGTVEKTANFKKLLLTFENCEAHISLTVSLFFDSNMVMPAGIPSDTHCIVPYTLGDTTVHVLTEGEQYWAVFRIGKEQYMLYTNHVDYTDCRRIITSLFDSRS